MYILYSARYSRSGLVTMVLEAAGLAYETRMIDLGAKEHRSPDFLAINPAGFVPALTTPEGATLHETPAIMLYLCERHRIMELAPLPEESSRGSFLTGVFYCSNDIQPELKRFYFPTRYAAQPEQAQGIHEQARDMLTERFSVLDRHLAKGGPFYLGERFSLVDLTIAFWATTVFPAEPFFEQLPNVRTHLERVMATFEHSRHIEEHRISAMEFWQTQLQFA